MNLTATVQLFDQWQEKRYDVLSENVNEWLTESKNQLEYASFTLKPRKSSIAAFIEADNYRAIEVVLEELQELYQLDGVFLQDENGTLIDTLGLVEGERPGLVSFLQNLTDKPQFLTLKAFGLNQKKVYSIEAGVLYVGLKVPVYYDVGDRAGEVFMLKKVVTSGYSQPNVEALSELEHFEFSEQVEVPLEENGAFANIWKLIETSLHKESIKFYIPVYSTQLMYPVGMVAMTQSTEAVRPILLNALLNSILPLVLLLGVLLYFYRLLMRRMLIPVSEMSTVAKQISFGEEQRLSFMDHTPVNRWSEVDALGVRFNQLMDALSHKQRNLSSLNEQLEEIVQKRTLALTDANKQLEKIAHTDALTSVGNRHAFELYWEQLEEKSRKGLKRSVGFCIIDCDYFKGINDTYGHHAGDQVLTVICDLIAKSLDGRGHLFRLGGDEFAVLFENEERDVVESAMQKVVSSVQSYPSEALQIKESLSVSIGIAFADKGAVEGVMTLFRQADTAMYVAKNALRNKCVIYDDTEHAKTQEELKHQNLHLVLDAVKTGDGITLFYQPIYNLNSGEADYFEVLTRLTVDDELVFPNVFMPIIERTNLQVQFDKMVILQVRKALSEGLIPKGTGVSINLSAESLVEPEVCSWFKPIVPFLKDYKIVIEITETTLITQLNEVVGYIEQFKQAGFQIALDDFGSGYSSISYLAYLPVNIIKFDISLARAAFEQQRSAKVIHSLVEDLSEMGYGIVIEGVEDKPMFDFLAKTGASHFQGYYIERPAAVASVELPAFRVAEEQSSKSV